MSIPTKEAHFHLQKNKCFYFYSIKHLFLSLILKKAIKKCCAYSMKKLEKFKLIIDQILNDCISLLYRHSEKYLKCCALLGSFLWVFIVQNICNWCPRRRNGKKVKTQLCLLIAFPLIWWPSIHKKSRIYLWN